MAQELPRSFDLSKVTIRNARSVDARQIWEWTESVQWNEALQDIQLYCDVLSDGFLVAEFDGKMIGCIFYVHIGGEQTFGGFALVDEALRGKGTGLKLFKERSRRIGERNFGINAVAERVQPNIKMGYKHTTWKIKYYHGTFSFALKPNNPGIIQICGLSDKIFDQVLEYDKGVHVFPREKFLRAWLGRRNVTTHVAFVDGKVVGYGLLSSATKGYRLAPLYADTQDAALILIESLVKLLPTGSDVALYVPEDNRDAMEIVQSENMVLALDPIVRQYTKWDVELPLQKVYGVSNLDTTML
ncbi:holothin acyltransferase-like [Lineus longissimus]|uniref:holothin acyltransferase-like n=1 Tax=Lineus longissimus TaxID=88925 RepID=UPI002B4C38E6